MNVFYMIQTVSIYVMIKHVHKFENKRDMKKLFTGQSVFRLNKLHSYVDKYIYYT